MQFLIFCSSVFVFECWKFAMTDRSLLYTVVKASHTLIHKRKLVLPRRATYCWVFNFLRDRGRECLKQVQRKIIVQGLCPIFSTCIAGLNPQIRFGILQWELAKVHTLVAGIYMQLPMGGGGICCGKWKTTTEGHKQLYSTVYYMYVILVHVDPFLFGGFDTNCILNRVSTPPPSNEKKRKIKLH